MSHPPSRPVLRAVALLLAGPFLFLGCDSRKPATTPTGKAAGPSKDADVIALAGLDSAADVAKIRTVFQQLDASDGAASRSALSEAERAGLTALLNLTPGELAELSLPTFSQTDAAYLDECLLVRAGVRTLKIDDRPAAEKARLGFEWACRIVYVDDRIPWPANPWYSLQGGSGVALSRAYVVLAVWQQLGLDGCLVGPPELKTTPSRTTNPINPQAPPTYAPARACGVQIGADLYLYDPAAGKALPAADGTGVLTLAQAREKPDVAKGFAADEVKTWQPFLAPPLSALSRRMEWLEERNPGNSGVRLFVNAAVQRAKFGGAACEGWNPAGDELTASRVLSRYMSEEDNTRSGQPPLRFSHRIRMLPIERLPKTNLEGKLGDDMIGAFLAQFELLRYAPNTARDLLLRGQYSEAMDALQVIRERVANARTRMDQDPAVQKDFERWADELQRLSSQVLRPGPNDPGGAMATRALQQFRSAAHNRDIERAFILGHAARPLGAEVTFLIAACVHERAERSPSPVQWRNAAEWWQRFLDASAQAESPVPARDPHARALLARCQQFAGK